MFDADLWEDILDKLYEIVSDIPDFKNKVFQGDRYPPENYPCAFIVPSVLTAKPITFSEDEWFYAYEIGVGIQGDDPLKNMKEAFRLANKIVETLESDRHLTIKDEDSMLNRALVHDTHSIRVEPDWRRHNKGLETFWVGVTIVCQKKQ